MINIKKIITKIQFNNATLNSIKSLILCAGTLLSVSLKSNSWIILIAIFIAYRIQHFQLINSTDQSLNSNPQNKSINRVTYFICVGFALVAIIKLIFHLYQ